ncbi:MAG: tetratricopeptide repeat protein [Chitinophagales bacterium]
MKWNIRKALGTSLLAAFCFFAFGQSAPATQTPNEVFKIAFGAYQQGNYDLALKNFNLAITIDPSRNYFYYNRGLTYKAMGIADKALSDFKLSNDLKSTAEAHYQEGLIYYEKNQMEDAQAAFEEAKLIREDIERLNFLLGMIYFKANRFEEATKCFYDFTEHVKNNADAYYYRGLCEAKTGKYAESIASFKFAMMYKNNDWKLYYKMYEIYLAMNDKENALYSISMVIELGEKKPEHYEERARLYLDTGNTFKYEEDSQTAKDLRVSTASAGKS